MLTALRGSELRSQRAAEGRVGTESAQSRRLLRVRAEGCPHCRDVGKCISICRNPQNYGAPDTVPSLQLTAPGAAIAVLEAMSKNGTPRHNHGLSVLYAFCGDIAPMDRSRFFGQSKDMFAMDHFQAACSQLCGPLINCRSFDVLRTVDQEDGRAHVVVNVLEGRGETSSEWVFIMRRSPAPSATEGCWLVHRLLPADSRWLSDPRI